MHITDYKIITNYVVAKKHNRHQRNWYSNQLILSIDKSLTTETSVNKSIRSHTK